jgi:4-amino-4-deoxy-L-arabinose transferase-like glycosyltransferase
MPLVATFGVAMMSAFLGGRSQGLKWAALSGFSLALAVLAKGPVALVLFSGIVGVYCLLNQKWIWTLKQTLLAGVLFAGTALPWFWLVWQENGFNFVTTFFVNHHLARYLTPIHRHSQPFWFFVAVVLVGFFPWSAFLGSSLIRLWKKRWAFWEGRVSSQSEATLEVFLWIWILFPLCFFSFSESKLAGYILPVFPALAMLAAIEWDRMFDEFPKTFPKMHARAVGLGSVAIVLALGVVIASVVAYGSFWYGSYLSLPLFGGALWAGREYRRRQLDRFFVTMVGSMTLFAALAYGFAAPRIGNYHSAKELVLQIKPWLSLEEPLISYRFFHHTAQYYSDYQAMPETIPDMDSLHQYLNEHPQKRYFILTKEGGLEDLQEELSLLSVTRKGDFYLVELPGK